MVVILTKQQGFIEALLAMVENYLPPAMFLPSGLACSGFIWRALDDSEKNIEGIYMSRFISM